MSCPKLHSRQVEELRYNLRDFDSENINFFLPIMIWLNLYKSMTWANYKMWMKMSEDREPNKQFLFLFRERSVARNSITINWT